MRDYLMTLTAVALLTGMIGMLAPEGDLQKYLRLVGGLCLLCVLAGPLLDAFAAGELSPDAWLENEEQEEQNYEEIYNQALLSGGERNAERIIENQVLTQFSLADGALDLQVDFEVENDTVSIGEIRILLRDEAVFADPRQIMEYLNTAYGCPCVVIYD